MNGAESLVHTLLHAGIDTVFANPGTSEMHFVAALDRIPGIRCILCLDETIVTGAADAYYRMTGRPAATLLHCGPGLANGVANLHNARRARSGIVNIVGDQATYHRPLDAPLTSDVEGIAAPVSAFVRRAASSASVGADAAAAIAAARGFPGHIATLILPANTAWEEGGVVAAPHAPEGPETVAEETIEEAAAMLRNGKVTMLLLGGQALGEVPLRVAWSITRHTGAKLLLERSPARLARGRGRVQAERVPYPIDQGHAAFTGIEQVILVNATPPVSFFAYPGKRGELQPEGCDIFTLSTPGQDGATALAVLAQLLGAADVPPADPGPRPERPQGQVTPEGVAQTLAAVMPEQSIIIDEGISFGRGFFPHTHAAPPHDWMMLTGGAIGDGIPMAVGAAIGALGRRVIAVQADGSAMYSLAGLWTQAHERLDVTTIIIANRKYAILQGELAGVGANPGRTALGMMDLTNPALDWCRIATGMGVEAAQATNLEELGKLLAASVARPGPFLIELLV